MEIPAKRNLFSNNVLTHDREDFRSSYAGSPPWDLGKPQPAFQAAADKSSARFSMRAWRAKLL